MSFFRLFLILCCMNLNASDSSGGIAPACGQDEVKSITKINSKVAFYTNQIVAAATALNGVLYPDSSATNPFSTDVCVPDTNNNNLNPCDFTWLQADLSAIENFSSRDACQEQIILPASYKPFGDCTGSNCTVQCSGQNCSVTNSISYQINNYIGPICSSSCGSDNECTCFLGAANSSQTTCPTPNPISISNNSYCAIGCQCATPQLGLQAVNDNAQTGINYFAASGGSIIIQCALCEDYYKTNNNIIMLKYKILTDIKSWLQDSTIKTQISKLQANCNSSSTSSGAVDICQFNPDNFIVMPIKKQNITVESYYNADNKTKNYCVLVDTNKQVNLTDLMGWLALIAKAISSVVDDANKNYPKCALQYEELRKYQQENTVLSEQIQLFDQQRKATALQEVATKLGIANTVLGIGMMAAMIMPESVKGAISEGMNALIDAMKTKVANLGANIQSAKTSIQNLQEQEVAEKVEAGDVSDALDDTLGQAAEAAEQVGDSFISDTLSSLVSMLSELAENVAHAAVGIVGDALLSISDAIADLIPK